VTPRVALVTGADRPEGIAQAVARRLRDDGLEVAEHTLGPGPWQADFEDRDAPRALVDAVAGHHGRVDVVVAAHARDGRDFTAEELDRCWAVNARASALLVQALAERPTEHGRAILFTSGQHLEPMPGELPYAISKGAIHQMTASLAAALPQITVNAINPGPVDTGWADADTRERVARGFPHGRWGRPEDIAAVVSWLASPDSAWVTGQVIDAEGGFRRSRAG
jgi:3-oxoacyl-[acyl-carrier protein] reductase